MYTFYPEVPFTKNGDVPTPRYAHDGDAGVDLVATEDVTLRPGENCKMGSGISTAIPKGHAGLVLPRSGLGSKGLVIKNNVGLIDSTYRGEIGLTLLNNNPVGFWKRIKGLLLYRLLNTKGEPEGTIHIAKGDRVAQLVFIPVDCVSLVQVETLDETERSTGGFGSTGVRYERP